MKTYAVIAESGLEGESVQGIWTDQRDASLWICEWILERKDRGQTLGFNRMRLYEVEGTKFTKLREFDEDAKQVYRK